MDTYDIDLLTDRSSGAVTGFDFKESGKRTAGKVKVIKRFAQLLLTVQGTDKTEPYAGCALLTDTVGINVNADAIILLAQNAVELCFDQIKQGQNEETPVAETLISAVVSSVAFELDTCDLTIDFTFADDISATAPITFNTYYNG